MIFVVKQNSQKSTNCNTLCQFFLKNSVRHRSVPEIFAKNGGFYILDNNSKSLCFIDGDSGLIIISKRRADVDALFLIITI